jgi:hypothetical protein
MKESERRKLANPDLARTISIDLLIYDKEGNVKPWKVQTSIHEAGLAVVYRSFDKKWVVVHVNSGRSIWPVPFKTRQKAQSVMVQLLEKHDDWTFKTLSDLNELDRLARKRSVLEVLR